MDPLQLLGGVGLAVALGYAAAAHKFTLKIRRLQQHAMSASIESTSRFAQAAIETLTEDYGHDKGDAISKLFKRCAAHGMALMKIDPNTGDATPMEKA